MHNFLKEISRKAKTWGRLNNAKYEGMKFHGSWITIIINKLLAQQTWQVPFHPLIGGNSIVDHTNGRML